MNRTLQLLLFIIIFLSPFALLAQELNYKNGKWSKNNDLQIPDSIKAVLPTDSLKEKLNSYDNLLNDSIKSLNSKLQSDQLLKKVEDSLNVPDKFQQTYDSLATLKKQVDSLIDLRHSNVPNELFNSMQKLNLADSIRNQYTDQLDSLDQMKKSVKSNIDSLNQVKKKYKDPVKLKSAIEDRNASDFKSMRDTLVSEQTDSTINKYSSLARQVKDSLSGFDQYQSPEEMLENYDPSKQYFSDTLPTLNEQIISKEALKLMDSLNAAEKTKRIRKKVDEVGDGVERVRYYTKSGWQKTFFEATLGLVNFDLDQFSISPVFGYELSSQFSGGVGFTYSHSIADSLASSSNLSINTLIRWDLWKRKGYIQVLNEYNLPQVSYHNKEFYKDNNLSRYRAVFGAGYRFKLTNTLAFVIQVDYNLNKIFNKNDVRNDFMFKFGINKN